jgi:uncharacterized membrane protein
MSDATPDDSDKSPARPGWLARLSRRPERRGRAHRPGLLAHAGHMEYDRILFFSDAVIAIAITLLIVDLPVQIERATSSGQDTTISSGTELRNAVPGMIGFGISFAVIGLFWVGHHGLFRYIKTIDRPLMLLNLLFLGTIAFLPYPTSLLSDVSSNQAPAVVFYAVCAGTAGLVETAIWVYATHARAGLVEGISPPMRRLVLLNTARGPAVFAVSIAIALEISPRVATYSWALIWAAEIVINRTYGQRVYGRHDDQPDDPLKPAEPATG